MTSKRIFDDIKYPLLTLCLWGIFHTPIEAFISRYIVQPFLSTVTTDNNPATSVALVLLFCLELVLVFRTARSKKVTQLTFLAWGYAALFLYVVYRMVGTVWTFTSISTSQPSGLAITDALLLPVFIALLIKSEHNKPKQFPSVAQDGFVPDTATSIDESNDPDHRYAFVASIAKRIMNTKNNEGAFAVAIVGKWGTGKSTFLKSIEKALASQKTELHQFAFNPWLIEHEGNVTVAFFKELAEQLSTYHSSVQNELNEYVDQLIAEKDNMLYSMIGLGKKIIGIKPSSIQNSKRAINEILRTLGKKIIIYIDDLDRLDARETASVMRIIRNSGDFANVTFVVAVDKSRIVQSLEPEFGSASESYLEKVFQIEFFLPPLQPVKLLHTLNAALSKVINHTDREVLNEMFTEREFEESYSWVKEQIIHYRDVKRYLNLFTIQYDHLKGHVYFPDLYVITFLRLNYPEIYYFIYWNKNRLFETVRRNEDEPYQLQPNDFQLTFRTVLGEVAAVNRLDQKTIREVENGVRALFPSVTEKEERRQEKLLPNKHLRIRYPNYFGRYFDLHFYGKLSQVEFDEAFDMPLEKWLNYIGTKNGQTGVLSEIGEILKQKSKSSISTAAEFEKILEGLLAAENDYSFDPKSVEDLLNPRTVSFKVSGNGVTRSHPHYELFGGEKEYDKFVSALFDKHLLPTDPFLKYLYFKLKDKQLEVSGQRQILTHLKRSFDSYLANHNLFVEDLYTLYKRLSDFIDPALLKMQLRQFITQRDLNGFISVVMVPWGKPNPTMYSISPAVPDIFDSEQMFVIYLQSLPERSKHVSAFLGLYQALKIAESTRVQFDLDKYLSEA